MVGTPTNILMNQTMIRGAHYTKKSGRISKNSTGTKCSWMGENLKPMPIMLYYLYGEEGYEGLT